jgi:hypothetical protein
MLTDDVRIVGKQVRAGRSPKAIQRLGANAFNQVSNHQAAGAGTSCRIVRIRISVSAGLLHSLASYKNDRWADTRPPELPSLCALTSKARGLTARLASRHRTSSRPFQSG